MPNLLPLSAISTPVSEIRGKTTAARLSRYPCTVLLLPQAPVRADWEAIPFAAGVQGVFAQKKRKAGDCFELRAGPRAGALLVVGVVADKASTFERLQFAAKWARTALASEPRSLLIWQQGCSSEAAHAAALALIAALQAAAMPLPSFRSKPRRTTRLAGIDLALGASLPGLRQELAVAAGANLARWLTALPPSRLDASAYRRYLQQLARHLHLQYRFYGEADLKRLRAGAFLAVSKGNARRDAGIVRLSYRPRGGAAVQLSLVGKGICFDTGGTNLKPHKGMLNMHTDMAGSAVAVGSLHALHALESPLAVDCWLAITENLIGPTAYKPQDVVRAHNGTTIQVIHTDAEGRMVLADALSLAAERKPRAIIDYATLTGACVYALTERYAGAFTNRQNLREMIEAAGTTSGERVWCFPMDEDFDTDLESAVADVMQCASDGKGDHILAARFLSRFVPKEIAWLHLDLAPATRAGGLAHVGTEITGFGVRYTLDLIGRGWPSGAARQ
jgi:leucyl aminopeptidase